MERTTTRADLEVSPHRSVTVSDLFLLAWRAELRQHRAAMELTIELAPHATAEVAVLVAELEDVLAAEYPPEQRHGLELEAIFQPHIRFFLARMDGVAVGCGGIALLDGFAEVKRMYVRASARGRGAAPALLARLEAEALATGRDVVRLETGTRQLAALRFYERCGFQRCGAFGEYAAMAPARTTASVFLEKRIAGRARG
jgi:putative acetyltransferase